MSTDIPSQKKMIECKSFCARCADAMPPILIPASYRKFQCPECGLLHYAQPSVLGRARVCKQCLRVFDESWIQLEVDDWEHIPAPYLCERCQQEVKTYNQEIEKGGVAWSCCTCGSSGVFGAESPISIKLRTQEGIAPPAPLGVQLQGGCPACSGESELPDFSQFGISNDEREETDNNDTEEDNG